MMPLPTEFATGLHEIDLQHRELLRHLSSLDEAIQEGRVSAALDALGFLSSHAASHFVAEERQMAASRYSKLSEHGAEHGEFTTRLHHLEKEFANDQSLVALALGLTEWLGDYLRHMRNADIEMALHFRGIAGSDVAQSAGVQ